MTQEQTANQVEESTQAPQAPQDNAEAPQDNSTQSSQKVSEYFNQSPSEEKPKQNILSVQPDKTVRVLDDYKNDTGEIDFETLLEERNKFSKIAEGFHKKQSQALHKAPNDITEYQLPEFEDEELGKYVAEVYDTDMGNKLREAYLKAGISKEDFQKLEKERWAVVKEENERLSETEQKEEQKPLTKAEIEEIASNVDSLLSDPKGKRRTSIDGALQQAVNQGKIPQKVYDIFLDQVDPEYHTDEEIANMIVFAEHVYADRAKEYIPTNNDRYAPPRLTPGSDNENSDFLKQVFLSLIHI